MNVNNPSKSAAKRSKVWRWLLVFIAAILLIPPVGLWVWSTTGSMEPDGVAQAALESDDRVTVVESRNGVQFWPADLATQSTYPLGFIFYPGGLVPAEAYAAHLRPLAEAGIPVFIPSMPLNFAIFDPNEAADIISLYPEIESWAIGGHSLGGSMAAQFAGQSPETVDALVLWASYPADNLDLSLQDLSVLSLYGTRDGLIETGVIEDSRARLPQEASLVPINGGNHAQFGRYGFQDRDLTAEISADEQLEVVVTETLTFLQAVRSGR
ncbi:MAG: alpha/beta hydrolase [Ardenticatenaceae bacterium]|nr:alpha/beta hydrolase [Ardenticatenaceae bacterium]